MSDRTESITEIVERCKAAQRRKTEELKAQGWHLCPCCKKVPLPPERQICAGCDHKKRAAERYRGTQAQRLAPGMRAPKGD